MPLAQPYAIECSLAMPQTNAFLPCRIWRGSSAEAVGWGMGDSSSLSASDQAPMPVTSARV